MKECNAAVVLAAGRGSRMRREAAGLSLTPAQAAAAAAGVKGMIPDARGRPFLDHVLSSLADAGITDACLVVRGGDDPVRAHYELIPPRRVRLAFAEQAEPLGTAKALIQAERWIAGRDVLVLNADNLYPTAALAALVGLGSPGLIAFERNALVRDGNIEASRVSAFALVEIGADEMLASIVEKPEPETLASPAADWVSMNLWRFDTRILEACRAVELSPRGEFELPLAVGLAVQSGVRFRVVRMAAGVLDLSSRGDIAATAALLGDREIQP